MTCTKYILNNYDITKIVDVITMVDGYILMLVVGIVVGYFIKKI